MRSYQSVLILKPDIEDTRVDEALGKIGEFIKGNGGTILKTEKWGKKRLAYRVKKNRFGIYLNLYHTLEPSGVIDLEKKYNIKTYIHAPTPELLEVFIQEGARKFILEGRECGGHIGPMSSLSLWERSLNVMMVMTREGNM